MLQYFNSHFYSVVASIALLVHLIINWRQLFNWRNVESRPGEQEFRRFLVILTVFFTLDVLWGVIEGLGYSRLLYADTALFFLAMALSILAWTRFIITYLEMDGGARALLLWPGRGMMAFIIAALAVNVFTGSFFTIDDKCVYSAGPLRQVAFTLLAAFNAYVSVATLPKMLRSKGAIRRRNKMLFVVGATMSAAIVIQLGDPFIPLYSLGSLFGCCLMHVFVIEDERDEMHSKEMLAHEYKAQLEAERAANQARSLFFSSISHDIRTPLNAIVGFSELLERGVEDEGERLHFISVIRSSGKVLARLVDDILDLSKMESGRLEILREPTDVPALAREVIDVCDVARTGKSLDLKTDIGEMPYLDVDPQRVRQLLFNLLSNAYKYTDRGVVTVSAGWRDDMLTISIEDTGIGISRENLDCIMRPFVQVADKNHRDGTGLGLAICQKLAALMGGELTVASKIGVGSTFTVTLRAAKADEPPAGRDKDSGRAGRPGDARHAPSRVLVVDDSPVNRMVLKAMLAKIGVTDIAMAENGREALDALKTSQDFDIVLTDLWMPEMDGQGLVRAIRADKRLSHLPVHLVTADVEARDRASSDGFTGVLLKPVTIDQLRGIFA